MHLSYLQIMSSRAGNVLLNFPFDTNIELPLSDADEHVTVVVTTGQEEDDFPVRCVAIVTRSE